MEFYGQRPDGFRNYNMHGGTPGSTYQPCARVVVDAHGNVIVPRGVYEMQDLIDSCQLTAGNSHELMRCLEVQNLMEMGKLVMLAAHERKESRLVLKKVDYPQQDDQNWFSFLAARQEGNNIEFRKVPVASEANR